MNEVFNITVGKENYKVKVLEDEIDHVQYEVYKDATQIYVLEQVNDDDTRCWVAADRNLKDKKEKELIKCIGDKINAHYN